MPGALTWDPDREGGAQTTFRGAQNPGQSDGLPLVSTSLTPLEQAIAANALAITVAGAVVRAAADRLSWASVSEDGGPRVQLAQWLISGQNLRAHPYGNSYEDGYYAIWTHFAAQSDGRISCIANGGVSAQTSAQVAARAVAAGAFDSTADIVPFGEGTNDGFTGVSVAAHIGNMRQIASAAISAGKIPIMRMSPPTDNAITVNPNTYWIAEAVLAESMSISYVDPWARYRDTDGTWTAGASSDGIHPTRTVITQAMADAWAAVSTGRPTYWLPLTNAGQGKFGSNVLQLTDSNADNLPDGWQTQSLSGATFNARTDYAFPFRGKRFSAQISQTGSALFYREITTGFSIGNRMRVAGVFGLDASSGGFMNVYVKLLDSGFALTAPILFVFAASTVTADKYAQSDFVIPSNTARIQVWVECSAAVSGAYTCTPAFGCVDVYDITANTY